MGFQTKNKTTCGLYFPGKSYPDFFKYTKLYDYFTHISKLNTYIPHIQSNDRKHHFCSIFPFEKMTCSKLLRFFVYHLWIKVPQSQLLWVKNYFSQISVGICDRRIVTTTPIVSLPGQTRTVSCACDIWRGKECYSKIINI